MRVVVFSSKPHDRKYLADANAGRHELVFQEARLLRESVPLAAGADAACLFVHDHADEEILAGLAQLGVKHLVLRCAGFNNVDVGAATRRGIGVARVPAYSPHGVAEHAVALLMTLNRRVHRAYVRVRDGNFALDGLLGFDVHGKTVGVVGLGKIGLSFARILHGFGARLLVHDVVRSAEAEQLGATYVPLDELFAASDIISLHCPLTPQTHHLINAGSLARMRDGVFLVNTSRGALVDIAAAIEALKTGKLGALALDVYEEEEGIFYEDLSTRIQPDDQLARLLTFPNVLVTSHQAFFTQEALQAIATTTISNLDDFAAGRPCPNALKA
jgi:D-lactate dehydrogenase